MKGWLKWLTIGEGGALRVGVLIALLLVVVMVGRTERAVECLVDALAQAGSSFKSLALPEPGFRSAL